MTRTSTGQSPHERATPSGNLLAEEGAAFMQLEGDRLRGLADRDAAANNDKRPTPRAECHDVIVIGGGQAGLAVGYYLARHGLDFLILDANERVGDSWRRRWDSLRVFTPARFNGLPGMSFPAPPRSYPTKDEVADFLSAYAKKFALPIRHNVRVERLAKEGETFVVTSGAQRFEAAAVVVAMSNFQRPNVPPFADQLDRDIVQLHSSNYKNTSQLRAGGVLVVGASDSGCEIALETASNHRTWLSGAYPPEIPFRIDGVFGRFVVAPLIVGVLFQHVSSIRTPLGRRLRAKALEIGVGPNVRVKRRDIAAAGIEHVARTTGVAGGLPQLANGQLLEAANVIWCTGYRPDYSWIDLPVFGDIEDAKQPLHRRGIVDTHAGLYFVGLFYTYALSSSLLRGIGRDAEHVTDHVAGYLEKRIAAA